MPLFRKLMILMVCSFSVLSAAGNLESMRDYYRGVGQGYLRSAEIYRSCMPRYYYVTPLDGYYGLARRRRDSDRLRQYYDLANEYFRKANELDHEIVRANLSTQLANHYAERQHVTVTLSPAIADATLVVNGAILTNTSGASRTIELLIGAGQAADVTVAVEIIRQGKRYTSPTKIAKNVVAGTTPTYVAFTELDFQPE